MKKEEEIIYKFLESQGYRDIIYEPDGNIPPDFLINNKMAVEVRRFNQNYVFNRNYEGLEQISNKLETLLKKIIKKVSDKKYNNSAFIMYDFQRPIPEMEFLEKQITSVLLKQKSEIQKNKEYLIDKNFKLEFYPTRKKLNKQYVIGAINDYDTGGLVVSEYFKNLNLFIKEKERKIKKVKNRYNTWWLALVDYTYLEIDEIDFKQINNMKKPKTYFDRILIVDKHNIEKYFYLFE